MTIKTAGAALIAGLVLTACDNALLDFQDPDIISSVNSASGAIALMNGVRERLVTVTTGETPTSHESLIFFGGLLADEWKSGDSFVERNSTDQRAISEANAFLSEQMLYLNRVRTQGKQAIDALRQYAPDPSANIGHMFAVTGFVENLAGEHFCNGIPFSDVVNGDFVYGGPITVDSAFTRAAAWSDSALQYIDGDEGSLVANLARIVKGRALLNRGQFAEAATAVGAVPTDYQYLITHSANTVVNELWSINVGQKRYVVADLEGGNGLPFVSANDPRVTTEGSGLSFDSQTPFVGQTIYGQFDPVAIASGIEARLIEAEAALRGGDASTWLAKLNVARATRTDLAPLTDPGDAAARTDLMFRERAFWMFGTGHRLGDLRRLIRQYGRAAETIFPTGSYPKGGNYDTDVNIPLSADEANNPNFIGCSDRNA